MKKNVLMFLLGGFVFSSITAGAAYVYTASDIGYQPQDTNWNVSNASEALSSLKEDLNNVNTNVTEYKQQITDALADKGVEVNENSSMADITSGITNLSTESDYVLLGIASWDNSSADTLTYTCTDDGILLIAKDVNMDVQVNGTATVHDVIACNSGLNEGDHFKVIAKGRQNKNEGQYPFRIVPVHKDDVIKITLNSGLGWTPAMSAAVVIYN